MWSFNLARGLTAAQPSAGRQNITAQMFSRTFVPYFHVVYTLPSELRDIAYQNKRVVYNLLKAAAETLLPLIPSASAHGSVSPPCCTYSRRVLASTLHQRK